MMKGKVIVGIIVVMLIIAVVVGALAAFTNVFNKDKTPAYKDKLEYKMLKDTDLVRTLYFNTDYEITDLDYINTALFSGPKTIGSASDSFTFYILFSFDVPTGGNMDHLYIGFRDIGVYGAYMLEALYVDYGNNVRFKELIYLPEKCDIFVDKLGLENLGYDIKTFGWQKKTFELAQFAGKGGEFAVSDGKWLVTQLFSGKFISVNGAFIEEV